jgi:hypothetical protein
VPAVALGRRYALWRSHGVYPACAVVQLGGGLTVDVVTGTVVEVVVDAVVDVVLAVVEVVLAVVVVDLVVDVGRFAGCTSASGLRTSIAEHRAR